jgi:hypothetical protein
MRFFLFVPNGYAYTKSKCHLYRDSIYICRNIFNKGLCHSEQGLVWIFIN